MSNSTKKVDYSDFVGIDVAKKTIDCWLRPEGTYNQHPNSPDGFEALDRWLGRQSCDPARTLICIESTGIYSDRLLADLVGRGWNCALVKTTATQKVAPEHHRKDDRFDARMLAEYGQRYSDRISLAEAPNRVIKQLKQLYAERQRLIKARSASQNRSQQADHTLVPSDLLTGQWHQQKQLCNEQIQQLESHIQQLIDGHEGLSSYYQLLRTIPGVGQVTGWLWLILFYGQQKLNHKQVASRFGFAPHRHVSGSSVRGRTRSSGHGQSQMRSRETMVARSVSYHHERFIRYKERKTEEDKPWPIIRNNIINKMIKIMCAIWNSGEPYQQDYRSRYDRQKKVA